MKKEDILNLVGATFGRLTVIEVIQIPSKHFKYTLKCQCECGTIKSYKISDFSSVRSCGCLRKEKWRKAYYAWIKDQDRLNK